MTLPCEIFFFFKQKTAYEMRISDWSSDVCSSDLRPAVASGLEHPVGEHRHRLGVVEQQTPLSSATGHLGGTGDHQPFLFVGGEQHPARSEEHTSELQSLMRISYAVFCLKKKKKR